MFREIFVLQGQEKRVNFDGAKDPFFIRNYGPGSLQINDQNQNYLAPQQGRVVRDLASINLVASNAYAVFEARSVFPGQV